MGLRVGRPPGLILQPMDAELDSPVNDEAYQWRLQVAGF